MVRVRALSLALTIFLVGVGISQDTKKDNKKTTPKTEEKKDEKKDVKLKGRLPNGWGKLGLTDQQKQRVYRLQAEYDTLIAELKSKLEKAKNDRQQALEGVLTAEQKKSLKQ